MKMINLKCEQCGCNVDRKIGEYKRSLKIGRKTFCSVSCSTKYSNKNRMDNGEVFSLPREFIGKGRCKTDLSIFKPLLNRIKHRKNTQEISITLEDIKELWEKQGGKCIYTKLKLNLPTWNTKKDIYTASMDRINPNIGYTKENCQIISVMANFAKNDFTDNDMKEFCKQIALHYNS